MFSRTSNGNGPVRAKDEAVCNFIPDQKDSNSDQIHPFDSEFNPHV